MSTSRADHPAAASDAPAPTLGHSHRLILDALFAHPLSHNVSWHGVVALGEALGSVDEKANGEFVFRIGEQQHVMYKPHGKALTAEEVMDFRHLITRAGCAPGAVAPAAVAAGAGAPELLIVVDHHEAKIYRIDLAGHGAATDSIKPYDPHEFLRHLAHKDQSRERGQRAHEDATFYERIAHAAAAGGRIVILGDGTGHSSAAHHLAEFLKSHHHDTYHRVILDRVADLGHLTEPQLLAIGRKAFA